MVFPVGNAAAQPIVFPFTAVDLTSAIDVLPNQWGKVGDMGMFDEVGVDSTIVELDYRDGFVTVMASAERGTIPNAASGDEEEAKFFKIPHFPDTDLITPKDVENRWAFQPGDRNIRRRRTLEDEVNRRLMKIAMRHDVTLEYLRMGALKGKIYDGKGRLLYDLFNTFGITQQVFNFNFYDTNFDVRGYTLEIARYIELNLHGDVSDGVQALVSPEFFSALIAHSQVKQFYLNWNSQFDRDLRQGFKFGAIEFIEYNAQAPTKPLTGPLQQQTQGMADMLRFIEANAGYAFPEGTRDSFKTFFAPPYVVNLIYGDGVKRYVSPKVLDHGKGVELFSESNPLAICKRPNVLCKLNAVTTNPG